MSKIDRLRDVLVRLDAMILDVRGLDLDPICRCVDVSAIEISVPPEGLLTLLREELTDELRREERSLQLRVQA